MWLVLAAAKIPEIASAGFDAPALDLRLVATAALELLLGIVTLLPLKGHAGRLACLSSGAVAGLFLTLALLMREPEGCGCFGSLGRADGWQRIIVSSAILYYSLEWWSALPGRKQTAGTR